MCMKLSLRISKKEVQIEHLYQTCYKHVHIFVHINEAYVKLIGW